MSANLAFDETYRRYLAQLADLDIDRRAGILGAVMKAGTPEVSFLGNTYRVSAGGVSGSDGKRPSHAVSVVLLKYFILCPESIPENRGWVSYRDFRDAAPFAGAFAGNTEQAVANAFASDARGLKEACDLLGGVGPEEGLSYDVAVKVPALPRVPLLVLFNDADAEFGASCSVLFESRAKYFLDMECLAIVGWLFSDRLKEVCGRKAGRSEIV